MTHSPSPAPSLPLFQYMLSGAHPWGTRVFADGRVEAYSDQQIELVNGDFVSRPVVQQWRPRATLDADQMRALTDFLRNSGFFAMPAHLSQPPPSLDGVTIEWSASRDGERHTVTTRGRAQAEVAPLETLRTQFESLVAAALSRTD